MIRAVAIHFVGASEAEWRLAAEIACGHEQVERPDGVNVEIVVGNRSGLVVGGLPGSVDDEARLLLLEEIPNCLPVADVKRHMVVRG